MKSKTNLLYKILFIFLLLNTKESIFCVFCGNEMTSFKYINDAPLSIKVVLGLGFIGCLGLVRQHINHTKQLNQKDQEIQNTKKLYEACKISLNTKVLENVELVSIRDNNFSLIDAQKK